MLSWIERQAAATLFGASISASVQDALKQFMEVGILVLLDPHYTDRIILVLTLSTPTGREYVTMCGPTFSRYNGFR